MEMFLQGRKEEAGLNEYSDKDSSEMSISECVMPNKSSKEKESQRQGAMHDDSLDEESSEKCKPYVNLHVGWQCSMREKSSHGMVRFRQNGKEEAGHDEYPDEDSTETTIFEHVMPNNSSNEKESE